MSFELKALKDICTIQIGKTPSRHESDYWRDGTHAWLSIADMIQGRYLNNTKEYITDLGVKASNIKLIPKNTLVLSYKLSIGKVGITQKPMYTNEAIASLTELDSQVDINYLYWALQHIDLLENADRAAMGKTLNKAKLSEVKIPLPPLAEQRRIASILDQADELRQKRQQAIEKLDQLLQATFIDMFGDPVDNLKELETVALLDLCKKVTDGTHQSPKWTTKGIPFLFISNIVDGEIDYSSQKFIDQATYDSLTKSTKIELNDILYTTVGSYGNVARVKSDQLFCFQRHIAHIKPDFDKINPKFLEKMLSSYGVRRQADRLVRGVAQKTLNLKDLKEIIVFNIPLVEQNHFVQKCEVIESLKIKSKLALNQADDLFKSLQNQAFSGNL
ncbi:restriction endonuclease subunit S [Acinetobacter pittii]|uniref:restriction endonuclease subunit S n=1 Tax=Acinetobacter pittii TaxID=48296 RepID=UPI0021CDCE94|nr:restriction endonuclease subunit S [Acinetobacter pittii]MCU4458107.1 restriction endonuclease subunit S [Acinetobacter pittii]MCU4461632.1 restriction endonuclease subunit S [Acinetobacter pittii]